MLFGVTVSGQWQVDLALKNLFECGLSVCKSVLHIFRNRQLKSVFGDSVVNALRQAFTQVQLEGDHKIPSRSLPKISLVTSTMVDSFRQS